MLPIAGHRVFGSAYPTAALGPERVDCPSLALGALCFWLVMVAARDGSGATRLSSEMESPALESGAPDKSRSEGETALMRLVRKYNWVRYLHVPLFGQMRGCQSANFGCITAFHRSPATGRGSAGRPARLPGSEWRANIH